MLIEQLDQLGEVGKRAHEPVDLVDHHGVDFPCPDVRQQGPESSCRFPGEAGRGKSERPCA